MSFEVMIEIFVDKSNLFQVDTFLIIFKHLRGKLFDFSLKNTQFEVIFEGLVGDGMGFRSVPIIQSRELCDVAKNARHKLRDKSLCLALFLGLKKVCIS